MIEITPSVQINDEEVELVFIRSPGPGGQNVNKVSSAVQLRFNVLSSPSIPQEVKQRLIKLAGRRVTSEGVLIIEARQYRSQERNRQAALERLVRLIQQACEPPKPRHKTKPTHAATLRRLETKRKRGEIKRMRRDSGIGG
ncbi:MAG: alternative ribosome rescue aminoacyl-tRNA hydrolase ArfB [Anaerolineales bacterium]|jgi:ribosome-associated protein